MLIIAVNLLQVPLMTGRRLIISCLIILSMDGHTKIPISNALIVATEIRLAN